ncbi:MAG: Sir2 family NAD-dependent protein deacetylase [Rubrobacteraceae bacterium]
MGSPPGRGRLVASIGESGPAIPSELVEALREARSVAVLTGSGISAESGVPTFREAQTRLWERYDPQQLATPEAFARVPKLVWEWYEWRRELVEKAHPNPGHRALAQLEALVPDFTLITQNVDGLHARAGSQNVIELHGNILRTKCSVEGMSVEEYENDASPPLCPNCGAPLRPDVVWFGEMLPHEAMEAAPQRPEAAPSSSPSARRASSILLPDFRVKPSPTARRSPRSTLTKRRSLRMCAMRCAEKLGISSPLSWTP